MKPRPADDVESFDFVKCEFPVPDPALQTTAFRTKSLARNQERYTITKDGRLIRHAPEGPPVHDGPYLASDVDWPIHGDLDLMAPRDGAYPEVCYVARFRCGRVEWIKPLSEARPQKLHEYLWRACRSLPGDYTPWGSQQREDSKAPGGWWPDCSGGCRHYFVLEDVGDEPISLDWGVCINPKSHRYGLLTFEHKGCPAYEDQLDRPWLER